MAVPANRPGSRVAIAGTAVALALIAAAIAIPALTGWNVHVKSFPPLHAEWMPRLGPGTPLAVLVGVAGIVWGPRLAASVRWPRLLLLSFAMSALWLFALATVDGLDGIGTILDHRYEYLGTAREVDDVGATLREYVERIPYAHEDNWPVHIAGHPPGALLFFVALVRLGLGSALAAGTVVLLVGATTVMAVLITLRTLGAEELARDAAPLLVFTPAAIWVAVSGDGMFMAVAAWGVCALALATRSRGVRQVGWSIAAGLILGYCVMLSYGLPLLGILAVAVLVAGRCWTPLPIAAVVAIGVVGAFAVNGFAWWEAFPVLQQRYWDGVASRRPPEYWMWGNLAAFAVSAGPAVGASLAAVARRHPLPSPDRVVLLLCAAGWLMVLAADLSNMSRAEVERIWLPFTPWATLGLALFAPSVRRWLLGGQVVFAIVVQSLLATGW
ncbi:putative integral membrane protein [Microbacterium sp. HM58-2]|nr:putative integral membrane protein [Microbacterium sp. HM58-2]